MLDLTATKKILSDFNILPRQSLGQNFLISKSILRRIIEISDISDQSHVLEIGPGLGTLTSALLKCAARVSAYEIDKQMIAVIEQRLKDKMNLALYQQDILQVNLRKLYAEESNLQIVANLPYYISTEIIEKLLIEVPNAESMTLMLQKEAAERISLGPNNSRYGPTAILLKLYGKITDRVRVAPSCFYPQPKVSSQVIKIKRHPQSVLFSTRVKIDLFRFNFFLQQCFAQRRKTIRNNLNNYFKNELLDQITDKIEQSDIVDLKLRPEQIPAEKFWQLYQSVANYIDIN
ncbi:MAG TPA: ribosomal RNA small subunit methyltransferase A [Clostridiaceae bacterium]|nr:ribosomal RNA small subunit methyltransferase A [Clostridiaceae bacterium]